jgi:hypothetical protein
MSDDLTVELIAEIYEVLDDHRKLLLLADAHRLAAEQKAANA